MNSAEEDRIVLTGKKMIDSEAESSFFTWWIEEKISDDVTRKRVIERILNLSNSELEKIKKDADNFKKSNFFYKKIKLLENYICSLGIIYWLISSVISIGILIFISFKHLSFLWGLEMNYDYSNLGIIAVTNGLSGLTIVILCGASWWFEKSNWFLIMLLLILVEFFLTGFFYRLLLSIKVFVNFYYLLKMESFKRKLNTLQRQQS